MKKLPDGQPDYTEYFTDRLDAYRVSYESTRNGCWAWMAINLCLGGETPWNPTPPPSFPGWVLAYLREVAEFIQCVGMPRGPLNPPPVRENYESEEGFQNANKRWQRSRIDNSKALQLILQKLELDDGIKGKNRLRDFANDMKAYQYAVIARDTGKERAIEVAQKAAAKIADPNSARRKANDAIRRGRERFPYLGTSLPPDSTNPNDAEK